MYYEFIRDMQVKEREGKEKVFIGIKRRISKLDEILEQKYVAKLVYQNSAIKKRLWTIDEEDFGHIYIIKHRNIIFMRERTLAKLLTAKEVIGKLAKILKCKLGFFLVLTKYNGSTIVLFLYLTDAIQPKINLILSIALY